MGGLPKKVGEIRRTLLMHKEELKKKYKIKELDIFGSFVRSEQKRAMLIFLSSLKKYQI